MSTIRAALLLGGNIGEVSRLFNEATRLLENEGIVLISQSADYRSPAWGLTQQPDFLNKALLIESKFAPKELLEAVLRIELQLGRVRREKFGPRTIDIDILAIQDVICSEAILTVPHKYLSERLFALLPLKEVWPEYIHLPDGRSIDKLINQFPAAEQSKITRLESAELHP